MDYTKKKINKDKRVNYCKCKVPKGFDYDEDVYGNLCSNCKKILR